MQRTWIGSSAVGLAVLTVLIGISAAFVGLPATASAQAPTSHSDSESRTENFRSLKGVSLREVSGRSGSPDQNPANSSDNVTNHGGPVMITPVVHNIFWLPTGSHFESNNSASGDTSYENLLNRFFTDVGTNHNHYMNIVTQYPGSNGTPTGSESFGGSYVDNSAYPVAGTQKAPLSDADIQSEVNKVAKAQNWTMDSNSIVMVYVANGIEECNSGIGACNFSPGPGVGAYCAYHSPIGTSSYSFMGDDGVGNGCDNGVDPNGDAFADAEISSASHEFIESVTDPQLDAWYNDSTGDEISDLCNRVDAARNNIGADVYLNNDPYDIQQQWSNAVSACSMDLLGTSDAPPTLTLAANTSGSTITDAPISTQLTVDNPSDTDASTLTTLTETLPPSVAYVSGSASPAPTGINGATLTWNLSTIAVHESEAVSLEVETNDPGDLTQCSSVTYDDALEIAQQPVVSTCSSPSLVTGSLLNYGKAVNPAPWTVANVSSSASGTSISGVPVAVTNSAGATDVYVEGGNGHLLQFHKGSSSTASWSVTDVTQLAGGSDSIVGTPAVTVNSGGVVDVYVEGSNGHLLEFNKPPNPAAWSVFDVTELAGGSDSIVGTPAVTVNSGGVVDAYVEGSNGHLLEFHKPLNPASWSAFDVTDLAGGSESVNGSPTITVSSAKVVDVYVEGGNGHLLQFDKPPNPANWSVFDVTELAGGSNAVSGTPTVTVNSADVVDVYVQGINNHLLQFAKPPNPAPWTVYDPTTLAGGTEPISGRPAVQVNSAGVVSIYEVGLNGHLLQYYKQPKSLWTVYDPTAQISGAANVGGSVSLITSGSAVEVFVG